MREKEKKKHIHFLIISFQFFFLFHYISVLIQWEHHRSSSTLTPYWLHGIWMHASNEGRGKYWAILMTGPIFIDGNCCVLGYGFVLYVDCGHCCYAASSIYILYVSYGTIYINVNKWMSTEQGKWSLLPHHHYYHYYYKWCCCCCWCYRYKHTKFQQIVEKKNWFLF